MLSYRNEILLTVPRRLGSNFVDEHGNLYQNNGNLHLRSRATGKIELPAFLDKDENDEALMPVAETDRSGQPIFQKYYGEGSAIVKSATFKNRVITVSITVKDHGIDVELSLEYNGEVEVVRDGFIVNLSPNLKLRASPKQEVVAQLLSRDVIRCGTENAEVMTNFVFDDQGNRIYTNYQTRPQGYKDSAKMQLLSQDNPRVQKLLQPQGFEACLFFSNHADSSNVDATKAIMYGVNKSDDPDYKERGFVGHGIKTQWTVFVLSADPGGIGLDDPDYKDIIDDLYYNHGHEIATHTIRHGRDNREENIEHLPAYAQYNARSHTDHSLGGGWRSSGLKSLGWDATNEEFYIMDLLRQEGFDNCWSYEDLNQNTLVDGLNMIPNGHIAFPHYILYKNTNLQFDDGEPIDQWHTWRMPSGESLQRFTPDNVDKLVSDMGFSNFHTYLALQNRWDANPPHFHIDGDVYRISDEMDDAIAQLALRESEGRLWVPTFIEWADYYRSIKQVDVECIGHKLWRITNYGDLVEGFNLLISTQGVAPLLNEIEMQIKTMPQGVIAWADLGPGESIMKF